MLKLLDGKFYQQLPANLDRPLYAGCYSTVVPAEDLLQCFA